MPLLDSLEMGKKALAAAQLSMDVTGQNIANANTEGYSRKRVNLTADKRLDSNLGQIGNGVEINGVQRLRNEFLDQQVVDRISDQGLFQEIDDALERVENIYNEPTDTSINGTLDRFWNAWHDLSNNPSDYASREAVKTSSQVLSSQFHTVAGQLLDYKLSINDKIATQVDQINALANDIKKLNDEVATAELGGAGTTANDSRDRRQEAIRALAEKIPLDYVEDAQGRVTVTTNGIVLVGPYDTIKLEMDTKVSAENNGQEYGMNYCRFANTTTQYIPKSGTFGGLFDVRDNRIKGFQDQLDKLSESLVKNVNEAHLNGYDLDSDTGIHFFDPTKTKAIDIDLSADILKDSRNIAAAATNNVTPVALPAEAVTPGALPGQPATVDLTHGGATPTYRYVMAGTIRVENPATGKVYQEGADSTSGDYWVDYKSGKISFNATVTPVPLTVDVDFKYKDSGMSGIGDGRTALELAKMKDKALLVQDAEGNSTQTIQQYYASSIGNLGIARNESKSNLETAKFIVEQLDRRQQEVAGVSLDEEMANMIKFEHSYQASARYISTINSMMDSVLGLVG